LLDTKILNNVDASGHAAKLLGLQTRQLNSLLNNSRMERLLDAETRSNKEYSNLNLISDLRVGLFSETISKKNVTVYRRNLQKAFIERLDFLINQKSATIKNSDINSIIRGELAVLKSQLIAANTNVINTITKYHYKDCISRIDAILKAKSN